MSGFERDYLDDIERDYENENIEPEVEKSKFYSSSKKKEEAADIEQHEQKNNYDEKGR